MFGFCSKSIPADLISGYICYKWFTEVILLILSSNYDLRAASTQ